MQTKFKKKKEFESKNSKTAITVCIVVVLVFLTLFVARLVDWQLIHGNEYKELATRSTSYTMKTDAVRGEILDRNGEGFVVNTTHYKLVIDKLYADEKNLDKTLLSLVNLMENTNQKWENPLPIIYKYGTFGYEKNKDDEIKTLLSDSYLNMDENTLAEDCVNALLSRYNIDNNYTESEKLNLASIHYNMELTDYSNTKPYVFASDIDRKAVSAVGENTQGVSGVEVQTYMIRGAEDGDIAPHLLGALGAMSEEEYKNLQSKGYALSDRIGKFGIERAFESELRGEGGTKLIKRNSDGAIVDTVETIDAKPGNSVFLTLDKKLQETAVKSLAQNVKDAKSEGIRQKQNGFSRMGDDCETGAVVMLNVKDFSVLAAASYPTYDLNKYSEYDDYYVRLSNNPNAPMFDRAFIGSFACGSVFKPCVAMAGLEEKVIKRNEDIFCNERYDYYPSNVVRCMHYHRDLNVTGAIEQSCNYFFAETGRRLGIEPMYLYAEKFGLGEYTGIEIEESKGILAGRDSTTWMPGNTVQAAIGQSDNAFTPLQLATYVATIANDGTRLKTHLVDKVTNYERDKIVQQNNEPTIVDTIGVSKENIKIVQDAMLKVTQDVNGTAYSMFGDYKVKVAAKTGTAENSGSDHTTFICYAPFENPEVAVAVVIEHGARGRFSMQVAKDLLDSYFLKK